MGPNYPSIAQCAAIATAFKILLFPAYKSTDFEVHRNWLAITSSVPVSQWYFEQTSEWTLDYPPLFAYFEWLLSHIARLLDPGMTKVINLGYDSWRTICYQRTTVIITELLLVYVLTLWVKSAPVAQRRASHAAALAVLLSPGLLIIDHIHFQYNGFLSGVLLLSLMLARKSSTILASGLVFATLLCLKHIYLYLAPAYIVFLLRKYCLEPQSVFKVKIGSCVKLGASLLVIFCTAFGPFLYWGQASQLFSRLFPFSRGLCHAYWAPNFWALYSFLDRILIYFAPLYGLQVKQNAVQSLTRGLVGDADFAVLPTINPKNAFILTILSQIFPLIKLFLVPEWDTFIGAIILCGYSSFLFGWHVHEKAILVIIIPFCLIATKDRRYFCAFRPLALAGHISLFPLLFTAAEYPIKTIYTVFWIIVFFTVFSRVSPATNCSRLYFLDRLSLLYMYMSIPLVTYCSMVHDYVSPGKYEFLPLLLLSTYSAIGVVFSWLGLSAIFLLG